MLGAAALLIVFLGATGYFNNEWGGATFFVELPVAGEAGDTKSADDGTAVLRGRVSSGV